MYRHIRVDLTHVMFDVRVIFLGVITSPLRVAPAPSYFNQRLDQDSLPARTRSFVDQWMTIVIFIKNVFLKKVFHQKDSN